MMSEETKRKGSEFERGQGGSKAMLYPSSTITHSGESIVIGMAVLADSLLARCCISMYHVYPAWQVQ